MKKWIIIVIAYIILIVLLFISFKQNKAYEDKWKIAESNVKAYDKLLSQTKGESTAWQLTADQLSYANDSILKELNATREKLKIKDKNLKSVQYISSTITKVDTITMKDTVFKKTVFRSDTLLKDKWSEIELSLRYPDTVIVHPTFKSEKNIIVSTKKETVNPPKKCWLLRLFQKKHTILNVDIIEKNPYIDTQESRYVEILK